MSTKTVTVESKLVGPFKIESKAADHTVFVDQPQGAGGSNAGPSPLQYLFVALSGCIISIARIVANQKKIALRGMSVRVDGDIDTDFLLGRTREGRAGFTQIRASAQIDADMTREQKEAFLHEVDERCPVSDNLLRGGTLKVVLAE